MNNKTKISQLQAEIDLLKKQEQDELISKVAPKYVDKYFKYGSGSYIHITRVTHVTEGSPYTNVRANDISLTPSIVKISIDNAWTISDEYLQEITESEFKRIALLETSKMIEQL